MHLVLGVVPDPCERQAKRPTEKMEKKKKKENPKREKKKRSEHGMVAGHHYGDGDN